MNMFARFDENPAMTLQVIKKQNVTDGRMHAWMHAHTHARTDNVKTVYPPQTKFAGGINTYFLIYEGGSKNARKIVSISTSFDQ